MYYKWRVGKGGWLNHSPTRYCWWQPHIFLLPQPHFTIHTVGLWYLKMGIEKSKPSWLPLTFHEKSCELLMLKFELLFLFSILKTQPAAGYVERFECMQQLQLQHCSDGIPLKQGPIGVQKCYTSSETKKLIESRNKEENGERRKNGKAQGPSFFDLLLAHPPVLDQQ